MWCDVADVSILLHTSSRQSARPGSHKAEDCVQGHWYIKVAVQVGVLQLEWPHANCSCTALHSGAACFSVVGYFDATGCIVRKFQKALKYSSRACAIQLHCVSILVQGVQQH